MEASERRAARENSRAKGNSGRDPGARGWLAWALLACVIAGAGLLIASEFQPLLAVKVDTVVFRHVSGIHHHSFEMGLIGATALLMGFGAIFGRSRPAMVAVGALGLIAAALALLVDLADARTTGLIGARFAGAQASPQLGFYLETLGAALLVIAGGAMLVLIPGRPPRRVRGPQSEARRRAEQPLQRDP